MGGGFAVCLLIGLSAWVPLMGGCVGAEGRRERAVSSKMRIIGKRAARVAIVAS